MSSKAFRLNRERTNVQSIRRAHLSLTRLQAVTMLSIGLSVTLSVWVRSARADVYEVGPGKAFASLQQVSDRLAPGDTVLLQGGHTYQGGVVFERPGTPQAPIVVRGVAVHGELPTIRGGTNTIEVAADHYVFENIVLTGGSYRCFFHHAGDIVLRNAIVRDCPNHGILSADEGSGSLLLDSCEVYHCGSGLTHHQIYVASDETAHPGAVFRMQHCYVHDGRGGNNVKSRAERNEIYFNWIEGAVYHELELIGPDGQDPSLRREDSDVVGNVLRKTNDAYTIRIGGDGTGETAGRYRFVNNTIVVQHEHRAVFRLFDKVESVEMHNNVLFRLGGGGITVMRTREVSWAARRPVIAGSHNWIPAGSVDVPEQWSQTIQGESPGFENVAQLDFRPRRGSALQDAAALPTQGPEGFSFPRPLQQLRFEPPANHHPGAWKRKLVGPPDIGAFEAATSPSTTEYGLEASDVPASSVSIRNADAVRQLAVSPGGHGAGSGMCGCSVPGAGTRFQIDWELMLALGGSIASLRRLVRRRRA